jgi:23S rRNA pseudouridine1911/1915/1917 synthase
MPQKFPETFSVAAEEAGLRLDQFLVSKLGDVSRARVQQLIEQQLVQVDGNAAKASLRLRGGERIHVLGPAVVEPLRAIPEDIPLDIVFEDADLAVINKPAGMMVHAGAGATENARNRGTLVNALLHRFGALSGVGGELRPGIVHRLDRETSGLIVVAKNDDAHRKLAAQFAKRQVKKTYVALAHGWVKADQGTINKSISRDSVRRVRMTTRRPGGREAITHYRVKKRIDGANASDPRAPGVPGASGGGRHGVWRTGADQGAWGYCHTGTELSALGGAGVAASEDGRSSLVCAGLAGGIGGVPGTSGRKKLLNAESAEKCRGGRREKL